MLPSATIELWARWARGFEPDKLTKWIVFRKKGTVQGDINFGDEDDGDYYDDRYGESDDDFDDEEDDEVHDGRRRYRQ